MSDIPDVDVIILSWNRVRETLAAIESARAQTGVSVAIYVVDQGSTPENLNAIRRDIAGRDDVNLIALDQNLGVPGGRNMASRAGRAPFIVALDNDAEFATPTTLRDAVGVLRAEPELGAIGFRILNHTTGLDDHTSWGYPDCDWKLRDVEFPAVSFVGAGHALRRKAFEEVGGYEDRLFFAGEELELGLKLLNLGYKIRYVGRVAIRHKVSPECRIRWDKGRFFYTVRNRIYLSLKSGAPLPRTLETAVGFVIKGLRGQLLWDGARGIVAGICMYVSLPKDSPQARLGRLTPDIKAYIDVLNHRSRYSFWDRLRNAWRRKGEIAPTGGLILGIVEISALLLQSWTWT